MGGLKSRLSRLKELGLAKASSLEKPPAPPTLSPAPSAAPTATPPATPTATSKVRGRAGPEGWEKGEANEYWRIVGTSFSIGLSEFEEGFDLRFFLPKDKGSGRRGRFEDLAFFDFETTGLSGGTGTLAFLAAVGWFEGPDLRVCQVFMDDFPGEVAFLQRVLHLLGRRKLVATYNGGSFDMPLLRTRCVLNRIPCPDHGHMDLLPPARRLWSGAFASCALQELERELLGYERMDDIPGFLIPRIWLDYSAGKDEVEGDFPDDQDSRRLMDRVFAHNLRDIVSLARLFFLMGKIADDPVGRGPETKVNCRRLAAYLAETGREGEGEALFQSAWEGGEPLAGLGLARLRRRAGDLHGYGAILASIQGKDPRIWIEKAKYWEHSRKDYPQALSCAVRAREDLGRREAGLSEGLRRRLDEDIELRMARLRRKSERAGKAP